MRVPSFNRRVFWAWLCGLLALLLAGIVWDVYLYRSDPTGEHTISWSIAVMTHENPGLAFLLGLGIGATVAGLAAHIWFGQMDVNTWREMQEIRFKCLCAAEGLQSNIPPVQKITACMNAVQYIEKVFPYDKKGSA